MVLARETFKSANVQMRGLSSCVMQQSEAARRPLLSWHAVLAANRKGPACQLFSTATHIAAGLFQDPGLAHGCGSVCAVGEEGRLRIAPRHLLEAPTAAGLQQQDLKSSHVLTGMQALEHAKALNTVLQAMCHKGKCRYVSSHGLMDCNAHRAAAPLQTLCRKALAVLQQAPL